MNKWRVTKYNPKFRRRGAFQVDDWTSASDIGKSFQGKILTLEQYLEMEDEYVSALSSFLRESQLTSLQVTNLETDLPRPLQLEALGLAAPLGEISGIQEGALLSPAEIETVCRLNLRELMWCRLEIPERFYVHFGYDYYMYIGSAFECPESISHAASVGLFVEEFTSPYEQLESEPSGDNPNAGRSGE